jgi:hypothetical protein
MVRIALTQSRSGVRAAIVARTSKQDFGTIPQQILQRFALILDFRFAN